MRQKPEAVPYLSCKFRDRRCVKGKSIEGSLWCEGNQRVFQESRQGKVKTVADSSALFFQLKEFVKQPMCISSCKFRYVSISFQAALRRLQWMLCSHHPAGLAFASPHAVKLFRPIARLLWQASLALESWLACALFATYQGKARFTRCKGSCKGICKRCHKMSGIRKGFCCADMKNWKGVERRFLTG